MRAVAVPSLDEVYRAHFAFVFRSARALGVPHDAVDDVVQDVFLVVHRRLPEFEPTGSMRAWLARILVHVLRDHRRRFRRKGDHDALYEEAHASPDAGPDAHAEARQAARIFSEILDSMDEDRRIVFVLAELEELTAQEISEVTGANVNTVSSRLRLARRDYAAALARRRAKQEGRSR